MQTKTLIYLCGVLIFCLLPARAEIGETWTQIETRFGQCLDSAGWKRLYRTKEEFCLVDYENEVSQEEHRFAPLTPEQRKGLRIPPPPFPAQSRPIKDGIGLYVFTFDGSGQPSDVAVVQSASAVLDAQTRQYALHNWRGTPASTVTLAIAYHRDSGNVIYGR